MKKHNTVRIIKLDAQVLTKKLVILFHGLGRTYRSMEKHGNYLLLHGYNVIYVDYPSRKYSIKKLSDTIYHALQKNHIIFNKNTNIVTHSLGGIIARKLIVKYNLTVNRIVMIAPPNQGSEIVDQLKTFKLFKLIMGPAAQELVTNARSTSEPINFELGIIAGSRSLNPLFSRWINGTNDGKVSVQSAKHSHMRDFCIVPYSHTFIMQRKRVFKQVFHFLQNGYFASRS